MTRPLWLRLSLFALFIACNAVICSIGVWNLSLTSSFGVENDVGAYLTFLGAFALLCTFPIVILDIFNGNTFVSKIWFECVWLALFLILEFAGAVTVSTKLSQVDCPSGIPFCASAKALCAFTWICTIGLSGYLAAFITAVMRQRSVEPQIWLYNARDFHWFETAKILSSIPSSPQRVDKGLNQAAFHAHRPSLPNAIPQESWVLQQQGPKEGVADPSVVLKRTAQSHEHEPGKLASGPTSARYDDSSGGPSSYRKHDLPKLSTTPSLYPQSITSSIPQSARSSLFQQSASVEPSPPPLKHWPMPITGQKPRHKLPPLPENAVRRARAVPPDSRPRPPVIPGSPPADNQQPDNPPI